MTDPVKRQTIIRWIAKLERDGPESHPALGPELMQQRHDQRIARLRETWDVE